MEIRSAAEHDSTGSPLTDLTQLRTPADRVFLQLKKIATIAEVRRLLRRLRFVQDQQLA